jgi:hypothetical protein
MTCTRCGGLLVADVFADLWEVTGPMEFEGLRCLNCGSIEDDVIRANRFQLPLPHRFPPSGLTGQERILNLNQGEPDEGLFCS